MTSLASPSHAHARTHRRRHHHHRGKRLPARRHGRTDCPFIPSPLPQPCHQARHCAQTMKESGELSTTCDLQTCLAGQLTRNVKHWEMNPSSLIQTCQYPGRLPKHMARQMTREREGGKKRKKLEQMRARRPLLEDGMAADVWPCGDVLLVPLSHNSCTCEAESGSVIAYTTVTYSSFYWSVLCAC